MKPTLAALLLMAASAAVVLTSCSVPRDESSQEIPQSVSDRSEAELTVSMAKLTWLGDQIKPVNTVWFRTVECRAPMGTFLPRSFRGHFGNDSSAAEAYGIAPLLVSTAEMARILRAARSPADARHVHNHGHLAFAFAIEANGRWEGATVEVGPETDSALYRDMLAALEPANRELRKALVRQMGSVVSEDRWKQATESARPTN